MNADTDTALPVLLRSVPIPEIRPKSLGRLNRCYRRQNPQNNQNSRKC